MSEQIVQVADASPSTKNMRTIQQTAGGNTVQSEVIVLATGAANGGDTYDARQIRTLTSADIVTAILQGVTLGQKTMTSSLPVVIASNQSAVPVSGNVTAAQGAAAGVASGWPVKITDGTNTVALATNSSPPTAASEGTVTHSFIYGLDVNSTLHALSVVQTGFVSGIPVAGGYADDTVISFPDTTVDKPVVLPSVANASAPPATTENGVSLLSVDLNRNLRTIVQNTPGVTVQNTPGVTISNQPNVIISTPGWGGSWTPPQPIFRVSGW